MTRRFAGAATIEYIDADDPAQREAHGETIATIRERGLIYPVTVIDGDAVYDGAVSYPGILRAIETKLATTV